MNTPPASRDGQHDFDFEIGTWKTRLSRRLHPLTGSSKWVEYEGTAVVRKVWNGRANLISRAFEVHPETQVGRSAPAAECERDRLAIATGRASDGYNPCE